jgi:hypothetical protein
MSNFDDLKQPSKLDTGWQTGAYVPSMIDFENAPVDQGVPELQIAWFMKQQVADVPLQELENREMQAAIQWQIANKIINQWGYPFGMAMPKEVKDMIKKHEEQKAKTNSAAKKRLKAQAGIEKTHKFSEMAKKVQAGPKVFDDSKEDAALINKILKDYSSNP